MTKPGMSNAGRHFRNALALISSGATAKIFVFLASVQIFKVLSVEDNGILQLGLSLGFLFSIISELGLRGYALREMSRVRDDTTIAQQLFSDVIATRVLLPVALLLPFAGVLYLIGYSQKILLVTFWLSLYALLDSFAMLLKYVLRAYERMHYEAVFSAIGRLTLLLAVLVLSWAGRLTLSSIVAAYIISAFLEVILAVITARWIFHLSFLAKPALSRMWQLVKVSAPFAVITVMGLLYVRTGTLLLSVFKGEEAVGLFNTAAKLPESLTFFPLAVVNTVMPLLTRNADDHALLRRYTGFLVRYVGYAAIAAAAVLIFETRWVILILSKSEYLRATHAFQLYGAWLIAVFFHYVFSTILISMNDESFVMKRYLVAVLINVLLNLVLIPRYGVTGAALALVLSEALAMTWDIIRLAGHGIRLPEMVPFELVFLMIVAAAPSVLLQNTAPPSLRIALSGLAAGAFVIIQMLARDRHIIQQIRSRKNTE